MRQKISFSFNWNNKLDCNYFTTIRLRNDAKYEVGKVYVVYLKDVDKGEAQIMEIKYFLLAQLNAYIAGLDTGYSLPESVAVLKKMYPNVNFEQTQLCLILLRKEKPKTNSKIALFCAGYMQYKQGLKYNVSAADTGKIKLVNVTEELITFYFTCDHFLFRDKHSISNYVKYYNELLALMNKPAENKKKHPDKWDKDYEGKLSGPDRVEYWTHLRSLGLTAVKRNGKTIDWK